MFSINAHAIGVERYVNVSVLIKLSLETTGFIIIILNLHKTICCGCVLESPRRGNSNTHSQLLFYGESMKIIIFIILIPTPDFPHFYYMLGGNLGSLLHGYISVRSSLPTPTPPPPKKKKQQQKNQYFGLLNNYVHRI